MIEESAWPGAWARLEKEPGDPYNCTICIFWIEGDDNHADKCRFGHPIMESLGDLPCPDGMTKSDLHYQKLCRLGGNNGNFIISMCPNKQKPFSNAKITCSDCKKHGFSKDETHKGEPICNVDGILLSNPNGICSQFEEINPLPESVDDWQLFTLKDAYADRPEVQYAVKGILSVPSLTIAYGAPSSLKTMVMMDMAVCIATGQPWLNNDHPDIDPKETSEYPVLWIDEDGGLRRTSDRFKMLGMGHKAPVTANLGYYSMPSPGLDASNPVSMENLRDRINQGGYKVVFIDCLVDVSGDVDENSAAMGMVMNRLRQLSEQTGSAIIVIHHNRKNTGNKNEGVRIGETLRGSSAIEGALDLAICIERDHDIVTIVPTKTRDTEFKPFAGEFHYEDIKAPRPEYPEFTYRIAFFKGVPVDEGSRATEKSVKLAIYDAIKHDGPTIKSKLVERVQESVKRSGGRSGRDYITHTIDAMIASNKLIENEGTGDKKRAKTLDVA